MGKPSASKLQDENAQLRERERTKTEFLSMASHDIANSVSTVNAAFEVLATRLAALEGGSPVLDVARNALRQIARLADDLVDWAAMERGKLRLERTWFDPAAFVEEYVRGFQLRAATKGVRFSTVLEPALTPVNADRRRMGQALMNLLENALRHTPCGGKISVGLTQDEGRLVVTVRDTGMGMDEATRKRLEEGMSVDKPDGRLGLGLAISRAVLARHGGKLWVRSDGPEKGSTFCFTIEYEGTPPPPQA
ncbi:MAG: HAMP domain-containing histidine kinase [Elusimicrobia bacterium]|nr:HAMP domain-containing histidine kinase [Elusimicrobiota bacterium]